MNFLYDMIDYMQQGGAVMWPLAASCLVMWYAICYRWYLLGGISSNGLEEKLLNNKRLPRAVTYAWETLEKSIKPHMTVTKEYIQGVLIPFRQRLTAYDALLSAVVTIAPLLGLLGTVSGMIDTFDTLGQSQVASQSMGISAGVSKALFTTQMGLVVAVPGILFKRILQRRQFVLECKLDEIQEHILHHTLTEVPYEVS